MANGYNLNEDVDLRTMTPNQRAHYDRGVHYQRCLIDSEYAAQHRSQENLSGGGDSGCVCPFLGGLVGIGLGALMGGMLLSGWTGHMGAVTGGFVGFLVGGTLGSCLGAAINE